MRRAILMLGLALAAFAAHAADLDNDGLEDGLEQTLLDRFQPVFFVSAQDCDALPARFRSGEREPVLEARDGTIYGQAFPSATGLIELHYFHLWNRDCGRSGHALDIEHVSARLESAAGDWRATHWFASAHQDTLCDLGQGATAATLQGETRGIRVYVSQGKHASFLSPESCRKGCGGDRCAEPMRALQARAVVNLGEWDAPMNGAVWIRSARWDFAPKLRTDFDATALEQIGNTHGKIAYLPPALQPVRATIRGVNEGVDGLALADEKTSSALDTAEGHTSGALDLGYSKTKNALERAAGATGAFLGIGKKKQP